MTDITVVVLIENRAAFPAAGSTPRQVDNKPCCAYYLLLGSYQRLDPPLQFYHRTDAQKEGLSVEWFCISLAGTRQTYRLYTLETDTWTDRFSFF